MEPCSPTGHVVCLGAPNSLRVPEEKLLSLYGFLLPVTAGTTGTVQEKNKAGFAHGHVFCLDFSLVIEKDIPAADKLLETKDHIDSYLEDPQKK